MPKKPKGVVLIQTTQTHGYFFKGREKEPFYEMGNAQIANSIGECLEKLGFKVDYDFVGDDE